MNHSFFSCKHATRLGKREGDIGWQPIPLPFSQAREARGKDMGLLHVHHERSGASRNKEG